MAGSTQTTMNRSSRSVHTQAILYSSQWQDNSLLHEVNTGVVCKEMQAILQMKYKIVKIFTTVTTYYTL
jgi:hypothetical protein